jgi:hypothetical protein
MSRRSSQAPPAHDTSKPAGWMGDDAAHVLEKNAPTHMDSASETGASERKAAEPAAGVFQVGFEDAPMEFRLYRRRFVGVVALVRRSLAPDEAPRSRRAVSPQRRRGDGLTLVWAHRQRKCVRATARRAPLISSAAAATFGISLTRVNWLSNAMGVIYLPGAILTPILCSRYGVRCTVRFPCSVMYVMPPLTPEQCIIGATLMIVASWIRFAGTAKSLSTDGAYALLIVAQIVGGLAQPVFQVMGPMYSELWFDLKGRTTVTMVLAICTSARGSSAC